MAGFRTLDALGDVTGKVALVRVDFNVPMADGAVTDTTRIRVSARTILELADAGAKVLLLTHFGRPKGQRNSTMSTSIILDGVEDVLGREVMFIAEVEGPVAAQAIDILRPGDIGLMENTRFWPGEEENDPAFAQGIAANGDLYVNDAFSASHRAHATTEGLAHLLPAFAGRAMQAELEALDKALGNPEKPVAAVVGGAKISTKLGVLEHLVSKVQHLIIGGGMANTFLAARGVDVGKSLCEHDLAEKAEAIMDAADAAHCTVHLPYDVVVAKEFAANPPSMRTCNVHEVAADEMILDIGPQAVEALADVLKTCRTLVWNGPLGAFETPPFDEATVALAKTAAALTREGSLVSVAGGGDTVAALNHAGVAQEFTYISTAGGAFLEWMEGRELPGVAALSRAALAQGS
jgi:phosphoglycerate kinase